MKMEYKYRKTIERKMKLNPIVERKYERMTKEVIAKGWSMKVGVGGVRKMKVSGRKVKILCLIYRGLKKVMV